MIIGIVCKNLNNYIGKNGKLLYHLMDDMENFKMKTTDNIVVMGRKTFESLPKQQPLANRFNIILTNNEEFKKKMKEFQNVCCVSTKEEAIGLQKFRFPKKDLYIIGGQSIYELFKDDCDKYYITQIFDDTEGDTIFPDITENYEMKPNNLYAYQCDLKYQFQEWKRKK